MRHCSTATVAGVFCVHRGAGVRTSVIKHVSKQLGKLVTKLSASTYRQSAVLLAVVPHDTVISCKQNVLLSSFICSNYQSQYESQLHCCKATTDKVQLTKQQQQGSRDVLIAFFCIILCMLFICVCCKRAVSLMRHRVHFVCQMDPTNQLYCCSNVNV
jgi:hypothetical protein